MHAKLRFAQMKTLLGDLYNTRSRIAHGSSPAVYIATQKNLRQWNSFFKVLNIAPVNSTTKGYLTKPICFALGLLEKHILGLIFCSKGHLTKGVRIIDELFVAES